MSLDRATSPGHDHPVMRHTILFVLLAACAGTNGAWRQVDPDHMMIEVTGRLEVLTLPPEGDVYMELTPVPGDQYSLAPGQQRLYCVLHERERSDVYPVLVKMRVGDTVRIGGYWTAREEGGVTRHYINDTTALGIVD